MINKFCMGSSTVCPDMQHQQHTLCLVGMCCLDSTCQTAFGWQWTWNIKLSHLKLQESVCLGFSISLLCVFFFYLQDKRNSVAMSLYQCSGKDRAPSSIPSGCQTHRHCFQNLNNSNLLNYEYQWMPLFSNINVWIYIPIKKGGI